MKHPEDRPSSSGASQDLPEIDPNRPASPGKPQRHLLGWLFMTLMATELLARMTDNNVAQTAAWVAMAAVILASARKIGLREVYLLCLSAVLSWAVWQFSPTPQQDLAGALSQATFLMAFILLLGLLHEAAGSSPSVEALGRFLARQPAGRRFYALFSGSGIMSILFNLGVVSFLVPLIQRGIRSTDPTDPLNPIRERRQVSALLRGFAWCVIWSPTAVAPLALLELIPDVDRKLWILIGFLLFLLFMVVGAIEDRVRFRAYRPRAKQQRPIFPQMATAKFALACGWLFGPSILISNLLDETIIFGLMATCPLMLVGWLVVQNWNGGKVDLVPVGRRLKEIAFDSIPQSARVAVTLGCSGFIGRAGSALVPADDVAQALGLANIPDFLLLSALPPLLASMSLFGLSPIMTAVFFGSFFGKLPVMPTDPTLLALSISMGWAMSILLSPLATPVLMINRVGGYAPTTLTWRWNLFYGVLSMLAAVPIFALLTTIVG